MPTPSILLSFSKGNAYLPRDTYTFSIPAGHTCPGADQCLSKCDQTTGKITDGPRGVFRCYAATCERYPAVRSMVWRNFNLLAAAGHGQVALIASSIPAKAKNVRIHVHGDFYSQSYFNAWVDAAAMTPQVHFWAFTKSIPFWLARIGSIPPNLVLNASLGGKHDDLVHRHGLKYAKVCFSEEGAAKLGLAFDLDDSLARVYGPSFALPVHGQQRAGSDAGHAAKALHGLRSAGKQPRRLP
jgi:hypothetical protein